MHRDTSQQGSLAIITHTQVTTKVHPRDLGFNATLASVEQSLQRLGRQQLHLVLLHYPRCWQELCGAQHVPQGDWHDSWRAVETLIQQGRVLAAGVSNFELHELVELWEGATIKPSVVQRFADPLHTDEAVRRWCVLVGVQYQAYSSLGMATAGVVLVHGSFLFTACVCTGTQEMMAGKAVNPVLSHHVIQHIADARGWTAVQVVLRWALQTGQAVLPRSSNPGHMADNLHVLQLTPLSETELAALDALGRPQARQ